ETSFLVCEGLPPIDAFVALMTGRWEQRGWVISTRRLPDLSLRNSSDPAKSNEMNHPPMPQKTTSNPHRVVSHGISGVGKGRKLDEETLIERAGIGWWAVAAGLGGHQAGEVASRAIVDALAAQPAVSDLDEFAKSVASTLQRVNSELWELGRQSASGQ